MSTHEAVGVILDAVSSGDPKFDEDALNRIVEDYEEDLLEYIAVQVKATGNDAADHDGIVAAITEKRRKLVEALGEFIREEVEFK